jgi:membrane protease YdiL (CAAX protease family)
MQPDLAPSSRGAQTTQSRWAARLRGFGPLGLLAMALIPFAGTAFIGALLVPLWAHMSRTRLRELGFVCPRKWKLAIAAGVVFGVVFKLVMKAVVMPSLGALPINQAYHYLTGNIVAKTFMALFVTVSGGFGDETVYRGFLLHRFFQLFGSGAFGRTIALLLPSLWFAVMHFPDQAVPGVEQALVTGLVFGLMFLAPRSLVMPMVTHAVFDLTALALIYWDLEVRVAHLLFPSIVFLSKWIVENSPTP